MLCVIDECLAIEVGACLYRRCDPDAVDHAALQQTLAFIRPDNGAEFTAGKVVRWLRDAAIGQTFIASDSPWQRGLLKA